MVDERPAGRGASTAPPTAWPGTASAPFQARRRAATSPPLWTTSTSTDRDDSFATEAAASGASRRPPLAPELDDGCRSYVKQGMGVGALAAIVGRVVAGAAVGAVAGAGVCRSFQTRRARWRLRQRSASLRDLPSVCLRARYAAVSGSHLPLL